MKLSEGSKRCGLLKRRESEKRVVGAKSQLRLAAQSEPKIILVARMFCFLVHILRVKHIMVLLLWISSFSYSSAYYLVSESFLPLTRINYLLLASLKLILYLVAVFQLSSHLHIKNLSKSTQSGFLVITLK